MGALHIHITTPFSSPNPLRKATYMLRVLAPPNLRALLLPRTLEPAHPPSPDDLCARTTQLPLRFAPHGRAVLLLPPTAAQDAFVTLMSAGVLLCAGLGTQLLVCDFAHALSFVTTNPAPACVCAPQPHYPIPPRSISYSRPAERPTRQRYLLSDPPPPIMVMMPAPHPYLCPIPYTHRGLDRMRAPAQYLLYCPTLDAVAIPSSRIRISVLRSVHWVIFCPSPRQRHDARAAAPRCPICVYSYACMYTAAPSVLWIRRSPALATSACVLILLPGDTPASTRQFKYLLILHLIPRVRPLTDGPPRIPIARRRPPRRALSLVYIHTACDQRPRAPI
ncbi:hypothetical protein B0H10DRAFT_2428155 [Mycena sp. CBHHK59/15]|nr:hypothetical protein B0H10DRAFT_2428155 [Mycena sp. CBHHK59/15]